MNKTYILFAVLGGIIIIGLLVFFFGPRGVEAPASDGGTASSTDEVPREEVPTGEETVTLALGAQANTLGFSLSPIEVMEDSRCPIDVVCVWAGSVRVRAAATSDGGVPQEVFFVLNTAKVFGRHTATLIDVAPAPVSSQEIASGDYRFMFRISAVK